MVQIRKIIPLILLLIILTAVLLPVFVLAEGESRVNPEHTPRGEHMTWELSGGVLTICGAGTMADYNGGESPWYAQSASIRRVVVGPGITSVGASAFYGCSALREVSLPAGIETVGDWAFFQCGALKSVEFPKGLASIGESAFRECRALRSAELPEGVTFLGSGAFAGCESLAALLLPDSLEELGDSAFEGCGALAEVYYTGAPEQWDSLLISEDNGPLALAQLRYGLSYSDAARAVHGSERPAVWAEEDVEKAVAAGLVPPSLCSRYNRSTTRGEFCALAAALYESLRGEISLRQAFSDTSDESVEKMAALGVVLGVGQGRFDPDTSLTREQAAAMLSRLCAVLGNPLPDDSPKFEDRNAISSWAAEAVGQMQRAGIMGSICESRSVFSPLASYSREQSIVTLYRFYEQLQ